MQIRAGMSAMLHGAWAQARLQTQQQALAATGILTPELHDAYAALQTEAANLTRAGGILLNATLTGGLVDVSA